MYREETDKGTILLDNDKKYIKSLTLGSGKSVSAVCPLCKEKREVPYTRITKAKHTMCRGCSQTFSAYSWMVGKRFGRLVVKSFGEKYTVPSTGEGRATFECVCDCGQKLNIVAERVKSGETTSCGCYQKEMMTKRIGETHPNFKPELTQEDRDRLIKERNDGNARRWKVAVKKRDGCCVVCESKKILEAHHLYDFNNNKDMRYEVENGVTLCKSCHAEFHSWMGGYRVPCTPADFRNFLNSKKRKRSIQSVGKSIFSSLLGTNQR